MRESSEANGYLAPNTCCPPIKYEHLLLHQLLQAPEPLNSHLIQNLQHPPPLPRPLIQLLHQPPRPIQQRSKHLPTILKTPRALHITNRIPLNLFIIRFLLQDINELHIFRFGTDTVDYWEREFAFGEIFAEAFVVAVFRGGQVLVVVADLEYYAHEVY